MFWGCFAGSVKGPCLTWEKDWGRVNAQTYCERVVPLIHSMISERPGLLLMQDNAPPHVAAQTIRELNEKHISPISWPPFSPDLNPIEAVWNKMKDFIQQNYPDLSNGRSRSFDQVRVIVREAWESISAEELMELVSSMPARCQAVVDEDGGPTKY